MIRIDILSNKKILGLFQKILLTAGIWAVLNYAGDFVKTKQYNPIVPIQHSQTYTTIIDKIYSLLSNEAYAESFRDKYFYYDSKNKVYEFKNPKLANKFLFTDDFDKFLNEQGGKALFVFYDSSNPRMKKSYNPIGRMVYDAKRIQEAIEEKKGIHMDIFKIELKDLTSKEKVEFTNVFKNYPRGDIDLPGIAEYFMGRPYLMIRATPLNEYEIKRNIKDSLKYLNMYHSK